MYIQINAALVLVLVLFNTRVNKYSHLSCDQALDSTEHVKTDMH